MYGQRKRIQLPFGMIVKTIHMTDYHKQNSPPLNNGKPYNFILTGIRAILRMLDIISNE